MEDNKDLYKDLGLELQSSKKLVSKLEGIISKLKEIIVDNDLQDEISDIDCTSQSEQICVNGITYIASLVEEQDFDDKDIKNFETLFKTLRTIRGKSTGDAKGKKVEAIDVDGLLKIVENGK